MNYCLNKKNRIKYMVFKITEEIDTGLGFSLPNLVFSFKGNCEVVKDNNISYIIGRCEVRAQYDYNKPNLFNICKKIVAPETYEHPPCYYLYAALKEDYPNKTITDL